MTSRLQLHLSARDLKNVAGLMGISDPFAVVTVRGDSENNTPWIVGHTDVVVNNLSPSWSRVIFLDGFRFGVPLYFEVGVFDFEASSTGKSELQLSYLDVHEQVALIAAQMTKTTTKDKTTYPKKFAHKVMGTAVFEVNQVLGSRGNVVSKSLQKGGVLTVHVERCKTEPSGRLLFHLQGHDFIGAPQRSANPFYELFRKVDRPTGAFWESVYRSNTVKRKHAQTNPYWNPVVLDLDATCNGDLDRAIKVVLWDHKRSGKHKYLGECETTIHGFCSSCVQQQQQRQQQQQQQQEQEEQFDTGFELTKDGKPMGYLRVVEATISGAPSTAMFQNNAPPPEASLNGSIHNNNSGGSNSQKNNGGGGGGSIFNNSSMLSMELSSSPTKVALLQQQQRPEFVDYLSGGCQISLAVAIDFTASNGDPREPGTPHYFYPPQSKKWNDYEKAIFAVGSILAKYDSDQRMPVWGFGAKYNGVVRHCFQCGPEMEVEGVQGIMDAYRGVFRTPLTMSFPTTFTEIIETASSYSRHQQELAEQENQLSYTILLILTSGNVEDVKLTKDSLMEASEDPLSVVIVGIGDADFTSLECLDEHDPNTEGGRDITKFVRFADFRSFNALTEAVLEEIPHQLVDYYFSRNIMPGQLEDFDAKDVKVAEADDTGRAFTFLG